MAHIGVSSSTLSMAGNLLEIIPRSVHASLLRNSLSVLLVTYTICLVEVFSPLSLVPDSLSMVAPRMSTP